MRVTFKSETQRKSEKEKEVKENISKHIRIAYFFYMLKTNAKLYSH